jgi:hypothetical protein
VTLTRDINFRMMLTEEEKRMLAAVADSDGLTASDVLRQFIRREYDSRFDAKGRKRPA